MPMYWSHYSLELWLWTDFGALMVRSLRLGFGLRCVALLTSLVITRPQWGQYEDKPLHSGWSTRWRLPQHSKRRRANSVYAMHRGGCLELYYCNMVERFWWDSSLIWKTNWFPSVLWHCWFGHMTCKNRPRNDL